ncbi:MAG: Gfo/Idh/MocA family oxidoreductase, partial [Acetobacteraceae bacterium]|nr:Gfo/Idh/MocA family oxidoreductase [Acetobacteraceae bacterium]
MVDGGTAAAGGPLRIGIIGCGRILPAHLDGLRRLKERGAAEFVVTALCARRREDAEMFRKRSEGPPPRPPVLAANDPLAVPHLYVSDFQPDPLPEIFTDYRDLFAADVADAFLVTTSLETHHEIGIRALEAGKHVLMEKPLAITVRAARRMVDEARRSGAVLATAENARYGENTRAARWAVESGALGDVQ